MCFSKKIVAACIAATLTGGAASAAVMPEPTVMLEPTAPGPFDIGDTVAFEMSTNAAFGPFLGFEGELDFDTSLLALTDIKINPILDFPFVDDSAVPVKVTGSVLFSDAPSGAFLLATFEFEALSEGTANVMFDGIVVDEAGATLFDNTVEASAEIVDSSIDVDPPMVPLPASLFLLMSGVAGMPLLRRVARRG